MTLNMALNSCHLELPPKGLTLAPEPCILICLILAPLTTCLSLTACTCFQEDLQATLILDLMTRNLCHDIGLEPAVKACMYMCALCSQGQGLHWKP